MLSDIFSVLGRMQVAIAVSLALAVLCLVLGDLAASSGRQLSALENTVAQNQAQLQQYHTAIADVSQHDASELAKARAALPNQLDVASVLDETVAVQRQAAVALSAFQFNPAITSGGSQAAGLPGAPSVKPTLINVTATGTEAQILAFLAGLESYPRFTTVQSVSYQVGGSAPSARTGVQSAEITFAVYTDP